MISRLNTLPARTPVLASPPPSRAATPDSGPPWFATPSMWGSLIPFSKPVYPGAQWVMSLPFDPRALAAQRSDVLAEMERIFAEEIARVTTRLTSITGVRTGSVGFPQRFGSSLNVHVHFHTLAIDGVFEKTAFGVRFHDAPSFLCQRSRL